MHQYQIPGFYWISVTSKRVQSVFLLLLHDAILAAKNVYDLTTDEMRLEVEVVDPLVDLMGMEVS